MHYVFLMPFISYFIHNCHLCHQNRNIFLFEQNLCGWQYNNSRVISEFGVLAENAGLILNG